MVFYFFVKKVTKDGGTFVESWSIPPVDSKTPPDVEKRLIPSRAMGKNVNWKISHKTEIFLTGKDGSYYDYNEWQYK